MKLNDLPLNKVFQAHVQYDGKTWEVDDVNIRVNRVTLRSCENWDIAIAVPISEYIEVIE